MTFKRDRLYAIILAGGAGTRLWPLSTSRRPKQFLDLIGSGRSMLQTTVDLLEDLVPMERAIVVTGHPYVDMVRSQLPELPTENLLVEPRALNTAPAMAVATALIKARCSDAVVVNLPSDHYVGHPTQFRAMVMAAATAAAERPIIVVAGVVPTSASTGFGYIELGDAEMSVDSMAIHRVTSFTEKPRRRVAQAFVESGRYLWNANYYTFHVETFQAALAAYVPQLGRLVWPEEVTRSKAFLREVYATAEPASIDNAMTQKAANIYVVPASFDWSDLGDWDQLYRVLASRSADSVGNIITVPDTNLVVTIDSARNLIIQTSPRAMALIGIADCIVIDIGDTLLVATRDDVQQVRVAAAHLAVIDDLYR